MGQWSRQELEDAFTRYQKAAEDAGRTGDWTPWVECFTADATYIEHLYGTFHGRAEISTWIHETMATPPADEMTEFPVGWYIVDEERGWIACEVWNRMDDPGDGSVHQAANFTLLKYAGDGLWASEEDQYNPGEFATMIRGWLDRKRELAGS